MNGQVVKQFELKGRVVDAESKAAIYGANIFNQVIDIGASTDKNGQFSISIDQLPLELEITYIGYEKFTLTVAARLEKEITIYLSPAASNLPEAVITAKTQTEDMLEEKDRILDFIFWGNNILTLQVDLETGQERLELLSPDGEIIDHFFLNDLSGTKKIHKTCLGRINIINKSKVHPVALEGDIILGLGLATDYHSYNIEVKQCVLANQENVYYQFYKHQGQFVDFHLFEKDRDTNFVFYSIFNEKQIRLFYEDIAPKMAVDNSTLDMTVNHPDFLRDIRDMQEDLDGWLHFFYQPIYCPLFQNGNKLIIFDHHNGRLDLFENNGQAIRNVPINYYLKENWNKQILQDEITEKFYTAFLTKNGLGLNEINIENGSLKNPIYFDTNGVEKMGVLNGQLFFMELDEHPTYGFTVRKLKKLNLNSEP